MTNSSVPFILIKHGVVAKNEWIYSESYIPGQTKQVLPLEVWNKQGKDFQTLDNKPGLSLDSNQNPRDFNGHIETLPVIFVNFPEFTDGRGFSLATLLRKQYSFKGELRACGNFIIDQLDYLKQCGFDAFQFPPHSDTHEILRALNTFSIHYQSTAAHPKPLFWTRSG